MADRRGRVHKTVITSDKPVKVVVEEESGGGWFKVFHAVVTGGYLAEMSEGPLKVLLALCHEQRKENLWEVWPSVTTLAKNTGLKERSVYMALKWLEDRGMLIRLTQRGGAGNTHYLLREPLHPGAGVKGRTPAPRFRGTPAPQNRGGVHHGAALPCPGVQPSPAPGCTERNKEEQEPSNKSGSKRFASLEERNKNAEMDAIAAFCRNLDPDVRARLRQRAYDAANDAMKRIWQRNDGTTGVLAVEIFKLAHQEQQV